MGQSESNSPWGCVVDWVEVVGATFDEARSIACEKLGVSEDEVELVVLSEPKSGLFGRVRGEARVRARVKPLDPVELRPQGSHGKGRSRRSGDRSRGSGQGLARGAQGQARSSAGGGVVKGQTVRSRSAAGSARRGATGDESGETAVKPGRHDDQRTEKGVPMSDIEIAEPEIRAVAQELLVGVAERFGLHATLRVESRAPDTISVSLLGDQLGLLIGARGSTLAALQDLLRVAVVQRMGRVPDARIIVDIAGYREKRAEALAKFVRGLAETVLAQQREQVLEPMSPADRKVVHDVIAVIAGLSTRSEGVDPSRRVIIFPSGDAAGEASQVS